MQHLYVHLQHDGIEYISDRSARQFLKNLGKAIRSAQVAELRDFISSLDLEYSQLQAMQDQVDNHAELFPAYYVEKLQKGSLTATVLVAMAFIGVFAQQIVVRVIEDPDLIVEIYEKLRSHIEGLLPWNVGDRIRSELEARGLGSHIIVGSSGLDETDKAVTLDLALETEPEDDGSERVKVEEHTAESVQEYLDSYIEASQGSPPRGH
jgi:hypothetical protein